MESTASPNAAETADCGGGSAAKAMPMASLQTDASSQRSVGAESTAEPLNSDHTLHQQPAASPPTGSTGGSPLISFSPLPESISSLGSLDVAAAEVTSGLSNAFDLECEDLTTVNSQGDKTSCVEAVASFDHTCSSVGDPLLDFGFAPAPPIDPASGGVLSDQQPPPQPQQVEPSMELLSFSPVAPPTAFEGPQIPEDAPKKEDDADDFTPFESSILESTDGHILEQQETHSSVFDKLMAPAVSTTEMAAALTVEVDHREETSSKCASAIASPLAPYSASADGDSQPPVDSHQSGIPDSKANDEAEMPRKMKIESVEWSAPIVSSSSWDVAEESSSKASATSETVGERHPAEETASDEFGCFGEPDHQLGCSAQESVSHHQQEDEDFGDFSGGDDCFPAQAKRSQDHHDEFGNFSSHGHSMTDPSIKAAKEDKIGAFSQTVVTPAPTVAAPQVGDQEEDDFNDFGVFQDSTQLADDDFGDFGAASSSSSVTFASQITSASCAASEPVVPSQPGAVPSSPSTSLSMDQLTGFFRKAFPTARDVPWESVMSGLDISLEQPDLEFHNGPSVDANTLRKEFVTAFHRLDAIWAGTDQLQRDEAKPPSREAHPNHIRFVLDAKIHEANRLEGVFESQINTREAFVAALKSDDNCRMLEAISRLQDLLFEESVNEATMRIAKQAALSAKARIAEQVSQQSTSRASSLFATTRHMLARSSSDRERGETTMSVLTPTGASVHKLARYTFGSNTTASGATGSTGGSVNGSSAGEEATGPSTNATNSANTTPEEGQLVNDRASDVVSNSSDGTSASALSSSSTSMAVPASTAPSSSSSSAAPGSSSEAFPSSSSGRSGLMKKFQDRLTSFSSSRLGTKTVNLRRTGKSGEEVRKMELNMDQINGGFDEVKWKCAVFLYDVEEVSQVAPSQITILSHPGNQVLACKTDRGALIKFLKPGTVWTIDIGKTEYDSANE